MSRESVVLLQTVWSWAGAITALLMLGVLLPLAVGFVLGALPLAWRRRDWRPVLQLTVVVPLVFVSGCWALALVHAPVPEWAFWLALSLQIGLLVFAGTLVATLRLAFRRIREDRDARASIGTLGPGRVATEQGGIEPAPRNRLNGIEAEYWIAEWMRHLGATESVVTPSRRDGGVDVRSDHYVAQVKHRPGEFVSVDLVRALAGVASVEGRTPLFFSSSHYSRDAIAFASRTGMALFIFRPAEGRLIGANALASGLRTGGLLGRSVRVQPEVALPTVVRV